MATFKITGGVSHFRDKLIEGMVARGYERAFAERTFSQIEGFGSYGFPESHAASFALIAYASSWMKCHHPDVFCAALLNSQPMGFYAPAQVVRDAREHGVEVRPVCINASRWDCTLEPTDGRFLAVRLGLRMSKGLANADAAALVAARGDTPFRAPLDAWQRTGMPVAALERIAEADGFAGTGLDRRGALWAIRGLSNARLPLFDATEQEPAVSLPAMTAGQDVVEDYASLGLSLRRHPLAFLRDDLAARGIIPCGDLARRRDGARLTVAGIVLVRQKPGSAHGVLFITLEDETGIANLVLWPALFERQRRLVLSAAMIACRGKLQREGEVIHVIADELVDHSSLLRSVGDRDTDTAFRLVQGRGDEAKHGGAPDHRDRARNIFLPELDIRRGVKGIKVPTRDFR